MNLKAKREDILDQLRVIADITKHPILEMELKAMSGYLSEYHSKELFEIIAGIPNEKYFPTARDIAQRMRKIQGLPPLKGLTEEQIEKNERELVVSGEKQETAKKGAEFMRQSLRRKNLRIDSEAKTGLESLPEHDFRLGPIGEDPLGEF